MNAVELLPDLERHDDLFERGIAGALADAVDGALDLARSVLDAGERVGDGQAEIVVAVNAEDGLVDIPDARLERPNQRPYSSGVQ